MIFKGLVSLVTGGASGLGRVTAEHLAKLGSRVVICDINKENGDKVVKSIGSNAIYVPGDITSEQDINNVISTTKEKFGRLDVSINCAGISVASKGSELSKEEYDIDLFDKILDVNLFGTFNVIRLAAGLIGENTPDEDGGRGLFINVTSLAALDGLTGQAAHSAVLEGVASMTLPVAREMGRQGIRVVSIAPSALSLEKKVSSKKSKKESSLKTYDVNDFAVLIQTVIENPMLNGETIRLDGTFIMKS